MASSQSGGDGPFQASNLAKWFHSAPHKDLELDDTTTIFSPGDESYREVNIMCINFKYFAAKSEDRRREFVNSLYSSRLRTFLVFYVIF